MTVSELIEYLQQLPPDMVVAVPDSTDGSTDYCHKLRADHIEVKDMESSYNYKLNEFLCESFDPAGTFESYVKKSRFYKGDPNAVAPGIKVLVIGG